MLPGVEPWGEDVEVWSTSISKNINLESLHKNAIKSVSQERKTYQMCIQIYQIYIIKQSANLPSLAKNMQLYTTIFLRVRSI